MLVFGAQGGRACPNSTELTRSVACTRSPCPVDCVLSEWRDASFCSASCGTGTLQQTRRITQTVQFGGVQCGNLSRTVPCTVACAFDNCSLSEWETGACTAACGQRGNRSSVRGIKKKKEIRYRKKQRPEKIPG